MKDKFTTIDIGDARYSRDREPEACPLCHHAVSAHQFEWAVTWHRDGTILEIVFRCPRADCGRLFVGRYRAKAPLPGSGIHVGSLVLFEVVPRLPEPPHFPEEIGNISPLFVEIFSEASAAESYGLKQIAGVGYRKALEFLIKDYCVRTQPADEEQIKKAPLGDCISRFVDDPRVKECARRAVWLGNDETHYVRKWADKDVGDLKALIELSVGWIHNCELTERYLAGMR
jgi:hypothetical protein